MQSSLNFEGEATGCITWEEEDDTRALRQIPHAIHLAPDQNQYQMFVQEWYISKRNKTCIRTEMSFKHCCRKPHTEVEEEPGQENRVGLRGHPLNRVHRQSQRGAESLRVTICAG